MRSTGGCRRIDWIVPGVVEGLNPRKDEVHARDLRKYPDAVKERAIRLCLDALKDPDRAKGCFTRIGDELGVNGETLRGWVRRAQVNARERPGTTTEDAARIRDLEKEVRELTRANAILKSASAFFAAEPGRPSR